MKPRIWYSTLTRSWKLRFIDRGFQDWTFDFICFAFALGYLRSADIWNEVAR